MSKAQAVHNKYEKAPTARLLARFAASASRVCLGVANVVAVAYGLAAAGVAWGAVGQILGAHSHATTGEMARPFFFLFELVVTL